MTVGLSWLPTIPSISGFSIGVLIVVFVLSFIGVVKSADRFTRYAQKLGIVFGMNSFIIGATIVAIGTSLPELATVITAVFGQGITTYPAATSVGSNIVNIAGVLGLGALVARGLSVDTVLIKTDLPFFFSSLAIFTICARDGIITRGEGYFLVGLFIIFFLYSLFSGDALDDKRELEDIKDYVDPKAKGGLRGWWKKQSQGSRAGRIFLYIFILVLCGGLLSLSADIFIKSLGEVADRTHVNVAIVSTVIAALGTSLPEIMTSIAALRQGNDGIAIGNVFGSNTFNLTLVIGLPAMFTTLSVDSSTLSLALPVLGIMTFGTIFATIDNKVPFWEGALLLFFYLVFLAKLLDTTMGWGVM